MSSTSISVDIHCHSSYKAYNSGHPNPKASLWDRIEHNCVDKGMIRLVRRQSQAILKESQSDYSALMAGNVRVAMVSITPVEMGFLNWRNLTSLVVGKGGYEVIEMITGFSLEKIMHLVKSKNYYFKELVKEYEFLRDGQGASPCGQHKSKIVNNYGELQQVLDNEPDTLAIIMSIEGGHLLGCGTPVSEELSTEELKELLTKNIKKVKSWEHPPFSINLAHHFWNQLSGHSKSFKGAVGALVNQNKGLDKGLTEAGRHALRELLSRENGNRIIIDTKHMSIQARKEYYGFVRNYNYLNPDDKIPVICSHTGMNGYKDLDSSMRIKDSNGKSKKQYLQKFSLNISNEEIRIIHESGGLVGTIMDKLVLGGGLAQNRIDKAKDPEKKKKELVRLVWSNIFQIPKAVGNKAGWDSIAIGSDFDGAITHLDAYPNAAAFPELKVDMVRYLEETEYHRELWFGYKPKKLVEKIFTTNALSFYERYFH